MGDELELVALEPLFDVPLVHAPVARNGNQLLGAPGLLRLLGPVDLPHHVQVLVILHVRTVCNRPDM